MTLVQAFGRNVRAVRKEKDWTQEHLAFEAGVKRAYLSEIESGKRNPTLDVVEKIAKALGVSPANLIDEEFEKERPNGR
jgi:transcriptional regulator with XRE-family HTH domain